MSQQVVLCHGCFDVLHTGHIYHLEKARALGDRLVVSITHEDFAKRKLHFPVEVRRHALESLRCVDEVIVVESRTAEE
ncbi:MAG TPA: adenylyltransferase/cytidyltransferase family protein, partial [Candidatus Obscuribacterales bacterium]